MISQKKLLLAILMIIVAVSMAGWVVLLRGFKTQSNGNANTANANISNANIANVNTTNMNAVINDNINSQPIDTSNWQTYRNEELGFEIKIPQSWRKYRFEVKNIEEGSKNVFISRVVEDVNALTNTKYERYYTVLVFSVFTQLLWQKELSYNQPHPSLIKISDDKVYSYTKGQDNDPRENGDIPFIIQSFQLIK